MSLIEHHGNLRLKQLDGLRGLAAFSVFLSHAFGMMASDRGAGQFLDFPLIRPLWDGFIAVILFFVLSGFVLTLPYTGPTSKKVEFLTFDIRRIFRLYPAYWVAILASLGLRYFIFNPSSGLQSLSGWTFWDQPITSISLVKHFFLIAPGLKSNDIDRVIWSLATEVKVSLIFPVVLLLVQKTKNVWYCLVVLLCTFFCAKYLDVLGLFLPFLFGSYIAKFRLPIVTVLRTSRWLQAGMGVVAYLLYASRWIMPKAWGFEPWSMLGVGIILCLFMSSDLLKRVTTFRPIDFLGDISYSFYLIHFPVLVTVGSILYPRTHSASLCILVSLAASLIFAYVSYRLIEIPGQNMGKALVRALRSKPTPAPLPASETS